MVTGLELDVQNTVIRKIVDPIVRTGSVDHEFLDRAGVHLVEVHPAATLTWTRDPFDRLIVADALVAGAPLLTKDRTIHDHSTIATW